MHDAAIFFAHEKSIIPSQERRQQEVEAQALENMQTAQEAAIVKMARATNNRVTIFGISFF